MPFQSRCVRAFTLTLMLSTVSVAQDVVHDPYPQKITKGDVRIELTPAAGGLTTPVQGLTAGDKRFFLVDQVGLVRIVQDGKLLDKPFLDVRNQLVKLREGFDERGLLGLAFHPGYHDKSSPGYGRLYTYTSEPAGENDMPLAAGVETDNISVVAEWQVSAADPAAVEPASRRVLLTFAQPQFNHNGGAILFDRHALLFIGTGDGGNAHDIGPGHAPEGNGQNLNTPLGKVLRIDPLGIKGTKKSHGRYSIPDDNPLVGKEGLDEIYAWGIRNPWRMCYDVQTDRVIAADVGQAKVEEILVIEKGGNYGWPVMEGEFYFIREGDQLGQVTAKAPSASLPKMLGHVAAYDHDEGISITGGFVYRGKAIPQLVGKYVFGDWHSPKTPGHGRLMYADLASGLIHEFKIGADERAFQGYIAGFGEDHEGELYVLTTRSAGPKGQTGQALKIVPVK